MWIHPRCNKTDEYLNSLDLPVSVVRERFPINWIIHGKHLETNNHTIIEICNIFWKSHDTDYKQFFLLLFVVVLVNNFIFSLGNTKELLRDRFWKCVYFSENQISRHLSQCGGLFSVFFYMLYVFVRTALTFEQQIQLITLSSYCICLRIRAPFLAKIVLYLLVSTSKHWTEPIWYTYQGSSGRDV